MVEESGLWAPQNTHVSLASVQNGEQFCLRTNRRPFSTDTMRAPSTVATVRRPGPISLSGAYITYIVRTHEAETGIAPLQGPDVSSRPMSHRISIERNTLRFAAAHMATFGKETESLHGHNYGVTVQIDGALSEDSWVIDFGEAKRLVRAICQELDHRVLLAARSPSMRFDASEGSVTILTGADKCYVIPGEDVAMLDIDNTTAERLAEWLAGRIAVALTQAGASNVTAIIVGIEEMPGQAGWFTLGLA